jgi:hypothetical protein
LESCQQALALLNQLPETPDRDVREFQFRLVMLLLLQVTKGFAAPETIAAVERLAAMAEKSGNHLTQLFVWVSSRGFAACVSGNLSAAGTLADQALDLALREGSPTILGVAHTLQIQTHYFRGDLSGVEEHFTTGLAFFDDPGFRELHTAVVVNALGTASLNAWTLWPKRRCPQARGPDDGSREREKPLRAGVVRGICCATPSLHQRIRPSRGSGSSGA